MSRPVYQTHAYAFEPLPTQAAAAANAMLMSRRDTPRDGGGVARTHAIAGSRPGVVLAWPDMAMAILLWLLPALHSCSLLRERVMPAEPRLGRSGVALRSWWCSSREGAPSAPPEYPDESAVVLGRSACQPPEALLPLAAPPT